MDTVILCDPVLINSVTYIGTVATALAVFLLELPPLPYPAGSLRKQSNIDDFGFIRYAVFGFWIFHFVRRTLEVFFVHIYRRKMPLSESLGAPLYYWGFALWIAWSLQWSTFQPAYLETFIIGTIIFVVGEAGNCYCHVRLRLFRTRQFPSELVSLQTGHVLPHGFLFDWVSCPHYLCEILSWTGFFLATCVLPALVFLLSTVVTLIFYARKKHKMYLGEFDGRDKRPAYPNRRRSLIPLLL